MNLDGQDGNGAPSLRSRSSLACGAILLSLLSLGAPCGAQNVASSAISAASSAPPAMFNGIARVSSAGDTMHVLVGHSFSLNSKARLRRVYVADPAILNSITLSPTQIIVTAMSPGVSSLVLIDEVGQAQSYVVSSDVDVQGLRIALSETMHNNPVNVEGVGGRVILSGNVVGQAAADTAVRLATLYSKDVANSLNVIPEHPKQVRLKVRILEVDRSKITQFGINIFNQGANSNYIGSATTGQYPSSTTVTPTTTGGVLSNMLTTTNPLNFLLYSAKLNLGATVQDLESKQVLQILAEPTITTISGQKANFLAGGEFPFPVIQPGGGSGSTASVTIQFRPYGVKLEFTPIVNDDGTIRLKVAPEVSALDYTNAVNISGYTIPALSTRKAETEVELRSDQSFAISGLLDQRTTDIFSKNPGAANIPIIGALFKSKNINHATTELVVIITPTLVDPLTDVVPPGQPDLPVKRLDGDDFDKSLGTHLTPTPAAPPVDGAPPFSAPNSATPRVKTPLPGQSAVAPPTPLPASALPKAIVTTATPAVTSKDNSIIAQQTGSTIPAAALTIPGSQDQHRYIYDVPSQTVSTPSAPVSPQKREVDSIVQIATGYHRADAEAMVSKLRRQGYSATARQDTQDSFLHLQLGPFPSRKDAEVVQRQLVKDGYNASLM